MIFKSGFLSKHCINELLAVHPLYNHLHISLLRALHVDFRRIAEPDYQWQEQESIPRTSVQRFLAASLYYNFHLASVIRFAGGTYVGAHMDADRVKKELSGIVPAEICRNVDNLLRFGAPHQMSGHSTTKKFYVYKRYGNHASIQLKPEKIKKVMNKEHKHKYAIALPCWGSHVSFQIYT